MYISIRSMLVILVLVMLVSADLTGVSAQFDDNQGQRVIHEVSHEVLSDRVIDFVIALIPFVVLVLGIFWQLNRKMSKLDVQMEGVQLAVEEFQKSKVDPHQVASEAAQEVMKKMQSRDTLLKQAANPYLARDTRYSEKSGSSSSQGKSEETRKQLEEQIVKHNETLDRSPDSKIYCERGIVKFRLGQTAEAIFDYNQAIDLNPYFAPAYTNRGDAKTELGNYLSAYLDYDAAISIDPNLFGTYDHRGFAKIVLQQYQLAIDDFNYVIELMPRSVEAYNGRGFAWNMLDQYNMAIPDFDEALRLDSNYVRAYINRGIANVGLNLLEEAEKDWDEGLRLVKQQGQKDLQVIIQDLLLRLNPSF